MSLSTTISKIDRMIADNLVAADTVYSEQASELILEHVAELRVILADLKVEREREIEQSWILSPDRMGQ